jgi:acetylornithine deacetylase/succinyl-diaminopimelate desuccinylase-like protein
MLRSASNRRQGDVSPTATVTMAALALVITIAAAAFGIAAGGTLRGAVPRPVAASAPATEFSSARALQHIRVVAREPHPMGSPANAAVRDYLVSQLRGLGLTPEIQRTTSAYYPLPGLLQAGTSENVLARLPGSQPGGKAFLLAAHYDSVPTGPGATDNGSGVASLLETLRALKAGPPLRNDVIFLFTDGRSGG